MHFALKGVPGLHEKYDVEITAVDNNKTANNVYAFNIHKEPQCKNVESLPAKWFRNDNYDLLVMSPPCQPFSRLGKQSKEQDLRCEALLYIINTFKLSGDPIPHILVENVEGFENSTPRKLLVDVLLDRGFEVQEFLLTPFQFGIPNSRPRYYLLARKTQNEKQGILLSLQLRPVKHFGEDRTSISKDIRFAFENQYHPCNPHCDEFHPTVKCLSEFLQDGRSDDKYLVNPTLVPKFHVCSPEKYESSCFTKGYPRHFGKSGSVLKEHDCGSGVISYKYFTEFQICRLLGFPPSFGFPEDIQLKKRYALLGNSLCVPIVTHLLGLLLSNGNG